MSALTHVRAPARAVLRLMVPGGLLVAALLLLPAWPLAARLTRFAPVLLVGALAMALALGWRFGRGQLAWGAVAVVLAAGMAVLEPGLRPLAAAMVALTLALLALLPERGILSVGGAARGAFIAAQAALLVWLATGPGSALTAPDPVVAGMSWPAWAALAGLVALGGRALRSPDALVHGLFWALAALVPGVLAPALAAGGVPGGVAGLAPAAGPLWSALVAVVVLAVAAVEEAHRLAYHDGLTGLSSRRALDERLPRMVGRYTVAMVDVDHFKKLNDRHGHDVGDQVLRMVAARLRETPGARVYRYGGEEFTLVFRGRSVGQVRALLEGTRRAIAERPFVIRGADRPAKKPRRRLSLWRPRQELTVTVSVGAAERSGWRQRPEAVLKEADQALYRAKDRGRNRVVA